MMQWRCPGRRRARARTRPLRPVRSRPVWIAGRLRKEIGQLGRPDEAHLRLIQPRTGVNQRRPGAAAFQRAEHAPPVEVVDQRPPGGRVGLESVGAIVQAGEDAEARAESLEPQEPNHQPDADDHQRGRPPPRANATGVCFRGVGHGHHHDRSGVSRSGVLRVVGARVVATQPLHELGRGRLRGLTIAWLAGR